MDSNIYVIIGASGFGKSTLQHKIRISRILDSINTEITCRLKRDYDEDGLYTASENELNEDNIFLKE